MGMLIIILFLVNLMRMKESQLLSSSIWETPLATQFIKLIQIQNQTHPYELYQDDPNFEDHDDPNQLPDGQYEVCHAHDWINCRRCRPADIQIQPQGEDVCRLCQKEGLPAVIYRSHHMLHPRCPSMSDIDKKRLYGKNWRNLTWEKGARGEQEESRSSQYNPCFQPWIVCYDSRAIYPMFMICINWRH